MSVLLRLSLRAALGLSCALPTFARATTELENNWLQFQRNPREFMDRVPVKRDMRGRVLPQGASSAFNARDISSNVFVLKKAAARNGTSESVSTADICNARGVCLKDVIQGRAVDGGRVQDFLDMSEFRENRPVASLADMEAKGLTSAQLSETPWSDTYWPISKGILGARYATREFSGIGHMWKENYDFIDKNASLKNIYEKKNPLELESLSPSEKYDLLIGTLSENGGVYEKGYLTPHQWSEGKRYWSSSGKVESWMGICHGWAPAAFMLPRPTNAITAMTADGQTGVKFFPSDIKGLASYLWAKSKTGPGVNFLGGRCSDKEPRRDPETGRVLDARCFDTTPGNWHVAIVNQIGVAKRSFVMDATYDYEVWNQPVSGYSYRYFNPQTGQEVATLAEATVPISEFTNDKFKKFRSPDTAFVVGISMKVSYVAETKPTHEEKDSADRDLIFNVNYLYDLELNSANQILGGEWYSNKHPDFLWLPLKNARAESYGDPQLPVGESWNPNQPLPAFWRDIAVRTAVRYGQPLATIVDALIAESRKEQP